MSDTDAPKNPREDLVDVLREGNVYASIWRNDGPDGPHFDATFNVIWRDRAQQMNEFSNFGGDDLLRLQSLAGDTHRRCLDLQREYRKEQSQDADKRKVFEQKRSGDVQGKSHSQER